MINVEIMTLDELGIADLILDYIPRVDDVLWFHQDPILSKTLLERYKTTSFIVKKVAHWITKPVNTMVAIHSVALYVEPEIIEV